MPLFMLYLISIAEILNIERRYRGGSISLQTAKRDAFYPLTRSDYVPGDLDFDPLKLRPLSPSFEVLLPEFIAMRNLELNVGRLAMLGSIGMLLQEWCDGLILYEHLQRILS